MSTHAGHPLTRHPSAVPTKHARSWRFNAVHVLGEQAPGGRVTLSCEALARGIRAHTGCASRIANDALIRAVAVEIGGRGADRTG